MIVVDQAKCIGCGQCIADCFKENLFLENGKATVTGPCMECGHCYAVCPTKAIAMEGYPTDDVLELSAEVPVVSGESLLNTIKIRRSIRQFEPQAVDRDVLARILEAGRFTPTGSNAQNVRYTVVSEQLDEVKNIVWQSFPESIEAAKRHYGEKSYVIPTLERLYRNYQAQPSKDGLFFGAPVLVVVSSKSLLNVGLAASNVELMAHAEGLGVLYSGFLRLALASNERLCEMLNLTADEVGICLVVGHPAVTYQRTVPRKPIKIDWL